MTHPRPGRLQRVWGMGARGTPKRTASSPTKGKGGPVKLNLSPIPGKPGWGESPRKGAGKRRKGGSCPPEKGREREKRLSPREGGNRGPRKKRGKGGAAPREGAAGKWGAAPCPAASLSGRCPPYQPKGRKGGLIEVSLPSIPPAANGGRELVKYGRRWRVGL